MTETVATSTPEQSQEVSRDREPESQSPTEWVSHPINIRISLPLLHRRFYLTLVAGEERRRHDRRKDDRQDHPLLTVGNVFFTLGVATLFSMLALAILIAQSAIIE